MERGTAHSLIKFCYTTIALSAVLTSHRLPRHAVHTETLVIVFPEAKQLVYDRLLLTSTAWFGYVPGVLDHADDIKIGA